MKTYKDIGEAFAKYCEAAREISGNAQALARLILAKIYSSGQIPSNFLSLCPPGEEKPKVEHAYKVEDSVKSTAGGKIAIGFLLKIRRGEDVWPIEYLRFNILVKPGSPSYRVELEGSNIDATFLPEESEGTHKVLNKFAQDVIEQIFEFYEKHPERWKNSGCSVVKGFSQV